MVIFDDVIGAFGATPALITALVLRAERRSQSRRLTGAVLAFTLAFIFLATDAAVAMRGGGEGPFGMTSEMTVAWVYIPAGLFAVWQA